MKNNSFSDLLRRAVNRDSDAIDTILQQYMPLINRSSFVDDKFDEDCRQYLLMRVAQQIPNFKF